MAVVLGTNAGFVTTAPIADPEGSASPIVDNAAIVTKDISPATAIKITEIGWWCDTATEEANFEVGLYASDGAVVPGEAGTRLYINDTNAKGTTAGWKKVTVDWDISPSTAYWLAVQLDNTTTTTNTNSKTTEGYGFDSKGSQTTLPNPFDGGSINDNWIVTIYAVWEAGATNYTETPSDNFTITENLSKNSIFNRNLSDTQSLIDSLSKNSIFNRSLFDTLIILDNLVKSGSLTIKLSDTLNLADTLIKYSIFNRTLSETFNLLDTLGIGFEFSLDDTQTLSDSLSKNSVFNRLLTDTQTLADVLNKLSVFNRDITDTQTLSDSFSKNSIFNRLLTDTQDLIDTLSRNVIFNRILIDTQSLSDSLIKERGINLSDTIALLDSLDYLSSIITNILSRRRILTRNDEIIKLKSKPILKLR